MERALIEKMAEHFKPVDRRVKEQELLIYLDKRFDSKFDRQIFSDLKSRLDDRNQELTPVNFARVYNQAVDLLAHRIDQNTQSQSELTSLTKASRTSGNGLLRMRIGQLTVERSSDMTNYLKLETGPSYSLLIDSPGVPTDYELVFPHSQSTQCAFTLLTHDDRVIDRKTFPVKDSESTTQPLSLTFNDNSKLTMNYSVAEGTLDDFQLFVSRQQYELDNARRFALEKRAVLVETFRDVYAGSGVGGVGREASQVVSRDLWVSIVLTAILGLCALYLNFKRCMFIDLFVVTSFFSNLFIWRYFNLFLGLRLMATLGVSVVLDVVWEISKIYNYWYIMRQTLGLRTILGFVIAGLTIVVKVLLIPMYYRVSKETPSEGLLALDEEVSVNQVDDEDYVYHYKPPI